MAPSPAKAMSPQAIASQNAGLRAALLQSAPRMRKNVLTATAAVGSTTRLKLFNVGVLTKLLLRCQIDVTIAVAIAVPSVKAPWNLINRVRLTDYDGTDRINLSGFQLWVLNSIRARTYYGFNNEAATAVFTNPQVPTAIGAASVIFFIELPVAFDVDNPVVQLQDLRGAIMAQTAVGEMYLNIDWITSLAAGATADVDSLYQGAATTTVVGANSSPITVTMWQDYLLPQAIGNGGIVPLPGIDLMTVYELNGNLRSSDNLALNTEKLISYPNVRSVVGAYMNFVNGGLLSSAVGAVRLIANGNNILMDNTGLSQLFYQRLENNSDLVTGVYFRKHREHPIETALFGNVQAGFTPNAAITGSAYLEIAFESFYTKGQALPGIGQAQ